MAQVKTIRTDALTAGQRARWIALIDQKALQSPLLHPDFALLMGRCREDTRIVVAEDGARSAFLPVHVGFDRSARPAGGPFSDYHTPIADERLSLNIPSLLALAGLRHLKFTAMIGAPEATGQGVRADITGTGTEYLEEISARNPKRFKQLRRRMRKLEREVGPVELRIGDASRENLDRLLGWKEDQFRETRRHNVLGTHWVRKMIDGLFAGEAGDVKGTLITLHAGGNMIAAEFGPSWNGVFHPWIATYDPAFSGHSPGHLLVMKLLETMKDAGFWRYDMGLDDAPYKAGFTNVTVPVGAGQVWSNARRPARQWVQAEERSGVTAKVRRRWDQIMATETELHGRIRGLASAATAMAAGG